MASRPATHAGSWYLSNEARLRQQLKTFCSQATELKGGVVEGAKVIISPHAGYAYSGNTMACAYVKLDLQDVKRVFILGPSHHFYFENRALLTHYHSLETPLGSLDVDREAVDNLLKKRDLFRPLDRGYDEDEHSLEMQFPMLVHSIQAQGRELSSIKVVPILISHNTREVDYALGRELKDYLDAGDSAIILSSDFCHWGRRFGYTGYVNGSEDITDAIADGTEIETLTSRSKMDHHSLKIYKSIELLDYHAMKVLGQSSGSKDRYQLWKEYLDITGNTICGEKPIGIFLCALSLFESYHFFQWVDYSQSSNAISLEDSSVSYAAGYCVL